jgi:hypothetical protein
MKKMNGVSTIFIDAEKANPSVKELVNNYYDDNMPQVIEKVKEFIDNLKDTSAYIIIVLYGPKKLKTIIEDDDVLEEFTKSVMSKEVLRLVYVDSDKNFRDLEYDKFVSLLRNKDEGLWIGKGYGEQNSFNTGYITKEMSEKIANNYGYIIKDGEAEQIKLIEFYEEEVEEDEE